MWLGSRTGIFTEVFIFYLFFSAADTEKTIKKVKKDQGTDN